MNKKKFKNVLIVLGGTSGERAISIASGKACAIALKKKGYKVSLFDPQKKSLNLISKKKIDVIFNALHYYLWLQLFIQKMYEDCRVVCRKVST